MPFELRTGERLDDLMAHGRHIIQSEEVFSFSLDAVLLAHYATVRPNDRILDLGTGNGVIPVLLTTRVTSPVRQIVGVELQERLADMARRTVEGNGLQDTIQIVQGNIKEVGTLFLQGHFDLVTCNPPYLPVGQGDANANEHVRIARHEVACTLADAVSAAGRMVKNGGKVAFVHRPDRMVDLFYQMRQEQLEPKRMRLVFPRIHQKPNIVLVEAIKHGKSDLKIDPPLIIYREDGSWSPEVAAIYNGRSLI
ncbi:tRNA1(Val) (adenine(37)-N6)-methyltransferase [Effusibacillus dendaii]|uniref:Methyltransferase n=1 Tax=Effusibacillus dendaii TaxID=2743772 RepID=A0A7I8DBH5_9BACL|nr:tRNA1(Val) (adenine(37)-N6)-methyltransferase [Effusibacillus dendaii]BCJ87434.1 methyltransferase [Effusibacillus dendaii]